MRYWKLVLVLLLGACQAKTGQADSGQNETGIYACDVEACNEDTTTVSGDDMTSIDFEQALGMMEEDQSGIFYFNFENCPWCQQLKPILQEVIDENDLEVYSVLTRDENDALLYDEDQKQRAIEIFGEAMSENENGELTLYVPLLVRIENGKPVGWHVGTLEDHDAADEQLSASQKEELKLILEDLLT